jgi:hypothetical protein
VTHTNTRSCSHAQMDGSRSTVLGKPPLSPNPDGWTDPDYRQHVYRCHILPIKCPGCVQLFESSRLFAHHLHAVPQCDRAVSEADGPSRGLETLLQKIRSPKLTSANASEEDRWKVLYTTLFPKDPKDAVPRPCKRRYSCLFSWVAV